MANRSDLTAGIRYWRNRPERRRHPLRWILGACAALAVLIVAAIAFFVSKPAPPPLTLPAGATSPAAGPVGGGWQVGPGSVAGFRLTESAIGFSTDVVGRTTAVTGTIVISADRVTSATFRIQLASLKTDGKTQAQVSKSLDTRRFPAATVTLTQPVALSSSFTSGTTITFTAAGELAMHGAARPVTITISARRDGSALQAAGSIPVSFPAWGIQRPGGFGFLGSLANHGIAEFLLILRRS